MILLKLFLLGFSACLPVLKAQSTPLFMNVVYTFDDFNNLLMNVIEPKCEEFLEKGYSGELEMDLPSFPNIAFSNLSFYNYSIDWNQTRVGPTPDPEVLSFTLYVDYFNCAFLYEYGIKKGNGNMLMEGIFLNLSVSANFSNDMEGLGFLMFIPGSPYLFYTGMQFDFENDVEFTDGVNFICDNLPTAILNNAVGSLMQRIPGFLNGLLTNTASWTAYNTIAYANLNLSTVGRVLNITIIQLEDQGITYSALNVSVVLNLTSQPASQQVDKQ